MGDKEREYPLADLIKALGMELREAQRRAKSDDQGDLLKLKECSVELGVTWEKNAEGGIDIKVFKLGGGIGKQDTETLSVTLEPLHSDVVVEFAP
jgi:hypothetical protein